MLTVSAWDKYKGDGAPDINTQEDKNLLLNIINRQYIPNDAVRTLIISEQAFNQASTFSGQTGCANYGIAGRLFSATYCVALMPQSDFGKK